MTTRVAVVASMLLLSLCSNGQDLLIKHADVPQYPQLAIAARLEGTLRFHVSVKAGAVTSIEPNSTNPSNLRILSDAAITNIRAWTFYASNDGFDVEFIYEISNREVAAPENPRIEMTLPRSVRLIAFPVKPTVNYER